MALIDAANEDIITLPFQIEKVQEIPQQQTLFRSERSKPGSLCSRLQEGTVRKSETIHRSYKEQKGMKRAIEEKDVEYIIPNKNEKYKSTRQKREVKEDITK